MTNVAERIDDGAPPRCVETTALTRLGDARVALAQLLASAARGDTLDGPARRLAAAWRADAVAVALPLAGGVADVAAPAGCVDEGWSARALAAARAALGRPPVVGSALRAAPFDDRMITRVALVAPAGGTQAVVALGWRDPAPIGEDERAALALLVDDLAAIERTVELERRALAAERARDALVARVGRLEQAAPDAELRALAHVLSEVLVVVETDGSLALANRPALDLFGLAPGAEPTSLRDLDSRVQIEHADGRPVSLESLVTRVADGRPVRDLVLQVRTPASEEPRALTMRATSVPDSHGRAGRVLLVATDGSELRRLEREKDDFLSLAAHELRTPLTPMTMLLQTLERKARGGVVDLDAIVRTRRQVVRLTRLISDLLDFSRVHDQTLEVHQAPLELGQLLSQVVDTFRSTAQKHSVQLELSGAPYFVNGDASRLEQVIVNLLDNAVKYSPGGGTVRVRAERSSRGVSVSVEDEGIGIPPEQQARLFERFFRADNASNRKFQGFGLGLYLAHAIVERHGGSMSVTSDLGRGSRFTFALPLLHAESVRDRTKTAPRVLLIDDDPDILHVAGDILEDEGYEVLRAHDGAEALRHMEAQTPDVVLLDLMMPVTDGWDVLERLRGGERRYDVPVIVLSAHDSLAEQATRLRADAWLGKPFEVDALVRKVAEFVPPPVSSQR